MHQTHLWWPGHFLFSNGREGQVSKVKAGHGSRGKKPSHPIPSKSTGTGTSLLHVGRHHLSKRRLLSLWIRNNSKLWKIWALCAAACCVLSSISCPRFPPDTHNSFPWMNGISDQETNRPAGPPSSPTSVTVRSPQSQHKEESSIYHPSTWWVYAWGLNIYTHKYMISVHRVESNLSEVTNSCCYRPPSFENLQRT